MAVGKEENMGEALFGVEGESQKGKSNQRAGKRSGENSDSCMHVVLGDGLSVCQSRYFCLFSTALLAARDTPRVIAGCLLSLAKKERGSGVCVCVCVCACKCVCQRE